MKASLLNAGCIPVLIEIFIQVDCHILVVPACLLASLCEARLVGRQVLKNVFLFLFVIASSTFSTRFDSSDCLVRKIATLFVQLNPVIVCQR